MENLYWTNGKGFDLARLYLEAMGLGDWEARLEWGDCGEGLASSVPRRAERTVVITFDPTYDWTEFTPFPGHFSLPHALLHEILHIFDAQASACITLNTLKAVDALNEGAGQEIYAAYDTYIDLVAMALLRGGLLPWTAPEKEQN